MRVVCENCGATYKIPDTKLVKEVNKATCRKCGFRMMIHRPRQAQGGTPSEIDPSEARTQVTASPEEGGDAPGSILSADTRVQHSDETEWSDEAPTQVHIPDGPPAPVAKTASADVPPPDATAPRVHAESADGRPTDMLFALLGAFASASGALVLALNVSDNDLQRNLGLGVALWGSLLTLFLLLTSRMGRQKGNLLTSIALGTLIAAGGTVGISVGLDQLEARRPAPGSTPATATAGSSSKTNRSVKAAEAMAVPLTGNPADALADAAAPDADNDDEERKEKNEREDRDAELPDPVEIPIPAPADDDYEDEDEAEDPVEPEELEQERRRQAEEQRRMQEQERQRAAAKAADEAAAKRAAQAAAPPQKKLSLQAVDAILRNTYSIKKCFVSEKKRSGQLPRKVSVKFTVLPRGSVSSARITNSDLKGGPLDSCMRRAFQSIRFPSFGGDAMTMTYPFLL